MIFEFDKSFKKAYKKIHPKAQKAFDKKLILFDINPFHPTLKNHSLVGPWFGHRSINVTGDIRAIFKQIDNNSVIFVALGTHSQLYS